MGIPLGEPFGNPLKNSSGEPFGNPLGKKVVLGVVVFRVVVLGIVVIALVLFLDDVNKY